MEDSTFIVFLGFAFFWIMIGTGALVLLFKVEGQDIKIGKQGLLVSLSILIPFLAALVIGAFSL